MSGLGREDLGSLQSATLVAHGAVVLPRVLLTCELFL